MWPLSTTAHAAACETRQVDRRLARHQPGQHPVYTTFWLGGLGNQLEAERKNSHGEATSSRATQRDRPTVVAYPDPRRPATAIRSRCRRETEFSFLGGESPISAKKEQYEKPGTARPYLRPYRASTQDKLKVSVACECSSTVPCRGHRINGAQIRQTIRDLQTHGGGEGKRAQVN